MAEKKGKGKMIQKEKQLVLNLETFEDENIGLERRIRLGFNFPNPQTIRIVVTSNQGVLINWLKDHQKIINNPIGFAITESPNSEPAILRFLIGSDFLVYNNDEGIPNIIKDFLFDSHFIFFTYNTNQTITRMVRQTFNMKKGNLEVKRRNSVKSSENFIALESLLCRRKRHKASNLLDESDEIVKPLLRLMMESE